MTYVARTLDGKPFDPHTCIFPIMKDAGVDAAKLVGTGFFITNLGHFVTAKHVLFDVLDRDSGRQLAGLHAVHFVEGTRILVRHITAVSYHNSADVAVGKMDYYVVDATGKPLLNCVPQFTTELPPVGSRVMTYAYPESHGDFRRGGDGTFVARDYHGEVLGLSEVARDQTLVSWPHVATSISLKNASSGGPVFDECGRVFGINCVGGLPGLSYMGRVRELLALVVPEFPAGTALGENTVANLGHRGLIRFDPVL